MNLRSFIQTLDEQGELQRVSQPVDWKYEIGRITRQSQGRSSCPALLFENINGYAGFSLLSNGLGTFHRIALALGLDPKASYSELVEVVRSRFHTPIPPLLVPADDTSYAVTTGEDVDLETLPVPWWHPQDGGRYMGTWHTNITRDPVRNTRNVGVYRMQLLNKRETAVSVSPGGHLKTHFLGAESRNRPLEMAVAIGTGEEVVIAGAAAASADVDEYALAGGLLQKPLKLMKCRTVDLEVPVDSEIVLEGELLPHRRVEEGPFFDYCGVARGDSQGLLFRVSCLMVRENAVFRGAAVGAPGAEDHLLIALLASAGYLDFHGSRLRQRVQNLFLRHRMFRAVQFLGRHGGKLKNWFSL
ncbi:MAG TPA: UbiD family decarboxylase [Candidatus Sumerlaeota bacterium]|nr:UbiD family decarboxylase [Candidatus Sumerlaeota bacterium]HPS00050.1 UbiD family decarboxylase [Candidatus Sumerlaeota bacterium]